MKCPKPGCTGVMYRFEPRHLVAPHYSAASGAELELRGAMFRQIGLMCDCCGYLEFYCSNPRECLEEPGQFFERTEPGA